jgi:predicted ester cyclase
MKRFLFLMMVSPACIFISCNDKSGPSAAAQKNLDAMHGINTCIQSKDFNKLGDYITEDAVDHAGEQGDLKGLATIKAELIKMVAGSKDEKMTVIKELADDEYVMSWQTYSGTAVTDQMGMKAGDKFNMSAIEVAKFKDGKATEHWSFMQPADMMKMMPPPPAPTMKTDTAKMMQAQPGKK